MSDVTKTFKYSQSGKKWSLFLLASVILITVWFAVYNHFLTKDINKITAQITEHESRIETLEWEKSVYIYSLIKTHKKVLDEMDQRSMVTKYMDHLEKMKAHYDFEIRGFELSWWKISSKVTFNNNQLWLAYKKATRFISDYREDTSALLDLDFIPSVSSTDDNIKFPVLFTLKK